MPKKKVRSVFAPLSRRSSGGDGNAFATHATVAKLLWRCPYPFSALVAASAGLHSDRRSPYSLLQMRLARSSTSTGTITPFLTGAASNA